MCGPADFSALGMSLARLTAIAVAGGGLLAAERLVRLLEDVRRREGGKLTAAVPETGSKAGK